MRLGAMLRLAVRSHQGASYASTHGISAQPPACQLATLRLPSAGRPIPARTVGGNHLGYAAQVSRIFATRLVGRVAVRAGAVAASSGEFGKRKVVFLGTPQIAAHVLQALLDEAAKPGATFEVAAVVTQPGRPTGRKRIIKPSPVEVLAREGGLPEELLLTPESAKDEAFLAAMEAMEPELCVTAAYGNFLPSRFLRIPKFGTLNIHPSLLPAFRGAAPVQRALQSGVTTTGVSLAFTVLKMDAGPIVAQQVVDVDPNIKAPQLLEELFDLGAQLLLQQMHNVWSGEAARNATEQDPASVIHTDKLTKEEALLDFRQPATVLHDKVRAFAGWPGTEAEFDIVDLEGCRETTKMKIITTRVGVGSTPAVREALEFRDDVMVVACEGDTTLEVLELQLPGKKVMDAKSFQNGLKQGKKRVMKVCPEFAR